MSDDRAPLVLLVDDDPVIVRLLDVNFALAGYRVQWASQGEEALELARTGSPDLVVLDLMMPGIDGLDLCERLKSDERTRDVPIIVLTARVQDEDRQRSYALGVSEYIAKPFDPSELIEAADRCLGRSPAS